MSSVQQSAPDLQRRSLSIFNFEGGEFCWHFALRSVMPRQIVQRLLTNVLRHDSASRLFSYPADALVMLEAGRRSGLERANMWLMSHKAQARIVLRESLGVLEKISTGPTTMRPCICCGEVQGLMHAPGVIDHKVVVASNTR